jgi:ABC-type sugar transport system substrate-binding protein
MKILKRILAAALILSMFSVFVGCTKTNETAEPINDSVPGSSKDNKPIYVGFVQVGAESDWRMANTKSMQETFTDANGYKFEMVDCQQKTDKQITAIRDFIQKGVDYIVLAPNTEAGWDTVLGEAKDAGIPVIIVDRMIKTNDESLFTAWVGSNFLQEGYDAVTALENALKEKGVPEDKPLNIVTLQGTMGSSAQIGRTKGFEEKMKAHSNWKMLDKQSGDFTQEKGQEVMESFLKSYKDIDVVIAENDNMAFGAVKAIKAAGKTCGPKGDITIISFDAVNAAFKAMIAGDIDADVECNPLHGPRVEEIIKALEAGQTVEKIAYVKEGTFYAKDAASLIDERAY